ncbi:MAG: hypothetical protein ACYC35_00750 [Pirellulales bacterium]
MSKVYLDTETCGLHSQMVLLQYAEEDGPIVLHEVWRRPIRETLALIEWLCEHTIVGFNLAFDWFHIVKCYTTFRLADPNWIPCEHIEEIALLEPQGQDGPCVKPVSALDLLLHSRKGPYQSLMAREDIRIRKVPAALAYALAQELEDRIELDDIYFAKSADKDAPRWQVFDRRNRDGTVDDTFKDVCLRFNPAGGLKFLAEHAMGFTPKYHYKDVEPDPAWRPYELGYAPTALAVSSPDKKWEVWIEKDGKQKLAGRAWPAVIGRFIEHWATRPDARDYATDDIVYTRALDKHFGCPPPGDDDSILACMVPVIRWRGFTINVEGMKDLLAKAKAIVAASPVNINKPSAVRAYMLEVMDDIESLKIQESTKKQNLESVTKYEVKAREDLDEDEDDIGTAGVEHWDGITVYEHCLKCDGTGRLKDGICKRCNGVGHLKAGQKHPAAVRALELLDVKHAVKEVELYTKLIFAKKFHASFNIVGTLSNRMSGGDGLNAQGIKGSDEVRCMFPLAWPGYNLCGGDFDSFEVTIADAVYNDPELRKTLVTKVPCNECHGTGKCHTEKCKQCHGTATHPCDECDGTGIGTKKLHALFAMILFECSYEEVMADKIKYKKGKAGVFAEIYGGNWMTLMRNLSISEAIAKKADEGWAKQYKGIGKARERTIAKFCSMKQPAGIGSQVVWDEPADYVESFLGFRRYFTLENKICRALFDLARKPPKGWRNHPIKVVRSTRVQTAGGAVASALYGAAFQIQAANMRAAANHEIQSPGGQITKHVQRAIWDIQPAGIHELLVGVMNIHDELMCSTHPSVVTQVTHKVRTVVESYRDKVPLIGMSWFEEMANWAEKKDGAQKVKIRAPEMM